MSINPDTPNDVMITVTHTTVTLTAGQLDDPAWNQAQSVLIDRYWSGEVAPDGRHAKARILWSDEALCVRYSCNQAEPLVINSTPQSEKKTIGLWDRDVCEIFIAPTEDAPENYFEFEAAPTGEWLDLGIHFAAGKRETDWEFDSGMTVATRRETDRVVIAMRIPWGPSIPKPQHGDRWRANLFRCVGRGDTRGYLAWQPTRTPEPNFHVPSAFGWLRFD
jgi:hypothetical protein